MTRYSRAVDARALHDLQSRAIDWLVARLESGAATSDQLVRLAQMLHALGRDAEIDPLLARFAHTAPDAERDRRADNAFVLLHIGKTGGTYTRDILKSVGGAAPTILALPHLFSLRMALTAWPGRRVLFGVRSPEQIFVSAFHSRRREGRPRYDAPWTSAEREVFARFDTPNALAESLSSSARIRRAAEAAMSALWPHAAKCLRGYLDSAAFVRSEAARVAFIFRQERLDEDLLQFLRRFRPDMAPLPAADAYQRHANPDGVDTRLSAAAMANLTQWYRSDFCIYRECLELAEARRRS